MRWRRILLACLWLLSLTGISFYGGNVSHGFFFAITLVPVISLIYLAFVFWRFRIYQKIDSRNVVCGQPVPYFFVLQNDDWFAFSSIRVKFFSSFSEVERLPDNPEYELLPGDKYTYETKLRCKYRGEYEVGVKEVVITDFLRLFSFTYRIRDNIRALVLPRIPEISEIRSIREINVFLQRESLNADTELDSVVRDYVPGDAMNRIHWRATAKEQKLMVRNRFGEEKQGITIIYDTARYSDNMGEYLPAENKILEIVLALGFSLAKRNTAYTVYQGGKQEQLQVSGLNEFESFYQKIAEISFESTGDFDLELSEILSRGCLSHSKVIFCVLQKLTAKTLLLAEKLAGGGSFVVIYTVTGEDLGDTLRQSSQRRKIIVISPEAELEGRL